MNMEKKLKEPLHILIDGADKLGKTTVIELLSRKLDLPVIKMPNAAEWIKDGSIEKVSEFYNETLIQFKDFDFIMDRGFPSSIVYSKVFERQANLDYITRIQQILSPKIFIFVGSHRKIEDDIEKHNLEWKRINKEFYEFAEQRSFSSVKLIDTDYSSPIQLCNQIIENL